MLRVEGEDIHAALLEWTRDWFDMLARGELAAACARLDEPNSYGTVWTPESIVALVMDEFGPGTVFSRKHPDGPRFTSARRAAGRERGDVVAFSNGSGFALDYDVPLNGEFSDLTAQFEFSWRAPNTLAARLHDLHVL
jgi:hypothetical protein